MFNTYHHQVLRDIRELIEKVDQSDVRTGNINESKFGLVNFIESTCMDKRNRKKPEYLLTERRLLFPCYGV